MPEATAAATTFAQATRRYLRTAIGAKTAMIPMLHRIDWNTYVAVGPPMAAGPHGVDGDRQRLVLGEPLEPRRHRLRRDERRRGEHEDGEDRERRRLRRLGLAGRQADEAEHPRQREGEQQQHQQAADEDERVGVDPEADDAPRRRPSAATTKTSRTRSAMVRPAITADRAIGSERNRSMRPFCRSSASPMAVFTAPKATVWTKMPGIR